MLRIGDWLKIGEREGTIQAWGIEVGLDVNWRKHPYKRVSRKAAYASGFPCVLVYFRDGSEEWWPLESGVPIPPPVARKAQDFVD